MRKNDGNKSTFQKTEQLLYYYPDFLSAIKDKEEQIKEIKLNGIPEKSKGITCYQKNINNNLTDSDKAMEMIKNLEKAIKTTKTYINIIDCGLNKLKDYEYFEIIDLKYFKKLSGENIAERLNIDTSTVSRNKNKLINSLKIILFSDEAIKELFI